MAQIQIKDLTFTYPKAEIPAIRNVSLEIEQGDFVVLCGKSGCGKSTLLRNLKPAIRPFGKTDGNVYWNGQELETINNKIQAEKIGFVMQSPEHQLVTDKVWHELVFGLENLGYSKQNIQLRIAEVSEYFDLIDWYDKEVDLLSGGQKQLVNLAATMTLKPEILILDEPTAQLDPIAAERFLDTLKKINDDFGITIILSEHRLNYVLPMADKMVIMESGEIICDGTVEEVLHSNLDNEFIKLMPYPSQIFYHVTGNKEGKMPISVKEGRVWLEALSQDKKNIAIENIKSQGAEHSVKCKNVWFRYSKEGKDVVSDLSLEIMKGEVFALLGGNGSGKTTTMSLLSNIYKPYRGKIKTEGKVSYLPQDVQTMFCKDTVTKELENVPNDIIELMELEKLMKHHPYDLSGGQQQKLGLAKVLAIRPDILLLDEPTKGIDGIYKEQLGKILGKLKEQDKTIIMVSHDIDFCGEYADRCGLLFRGNVLAVGNSHEFFGGNRFYTTTVNKMAGNVIEGAVNVEDLICFLKEDNTI